MNVRWPRPPRKNCLPHGASALVAPANKKETGSACLHLARRVSVPRNLRRQRRRAVYIAYSSITSRALTIDGRRRMVEYVTGQPILTRTVPYRPPLMAVGVVRSLQARSG